jgi:hypothetical protein
MSTTATQSRTDREPLIALLEKNAERYLAVLGAVEESAAGVKLGDNCWSILQVAEHVAAVEHAMLRGLQLNREKTSPPEVAKDEFISTAVRNRSVKLQAPEMVSPKGRWLTLFECAEAFRRSRANTIEYVRGAENLRGKSLMHPLLGEIDGHQAVLVMASHPERHILQIEEIKASTAYKAAAE